MLKTYQRQVRLLRQLAYGIGKPTNNLERYCLRSHIDKIKEVRDNMRADGYFSDAQKVTTTIMALEANLL